MTAARGAKQNIGNGDGIDEADKNIETQGHVIDRNDDVFDNRDPYDDHDFPDVDVDRYVDKSKISMTTTMKAQIPRTAAVANRCRRSQRRRWLRKRWQKVQTSPSGQV